MYRLISVAVLLAFCGCSQKEFDPADPAGSFAIAQEPYDDGDYEIAIQKLGEYKARFPYSKFAINAELLIANSHFELGHYEEAAAAYAQFVKLHPKHEKIDFAMYRVGESYWAEAPEGIDRDQEYTGKAIEEWEKLVARMPESSYAKKAEKQIVEGRRRIAESFEFVSQFYCKLDIYSACAFRYIQLAEQFPQFKDLRKTALLEAAQALDQVAKQKAADPESDKNIYFQRMTADQIRERAKQLRALAKT